MLSAMHNTLQALFYKAKTRHKLFEVDPMSISILSVREWKVRMDKYSVGQKVPLVFFHNMALGVLSCL